MTDFGHEVAEKIADLVRRRSPATDVMQPAVQEDASAADAESDAQALPTDTHFGRLWGLHNTGQNVNGTADADIDAPEAWVHEVGRRHVVVAVIDTVDPVANDTIGSLAWDGAAIRCANVTTGAGFINRINAGR